MLETIIQSNDCLFQVKIGDDFVSVACGKSFTVTINTDEKETTTVGDGQFKTFDYKVLSYTANLNGGMRIPDALTTTIFDFVEFQKGFIPIEFRAVWIDPAGGTRFFQGVGIIKSTNMVASASQLADGSVDILGSGEFETGDTIADKITLNIISTGNDAAPAFLKFKLINTDGEVVFQTDILPQASGGNLGNPFNINVLAPAGSFYVYWYCDSNLVGNTFETNAPPTLLQAFNNGVVQYSSYPLQLYDFTANRTVTFTLGVNNPGPGCVAPGHNGLNNTAGTTGTLYTGTVTLTGSQPFTLSNIIKPAWLNISLVNNIVTLSGMPTAGLNQPVSFDMTNSCGTSSFSDEIDISASPTANVVNYTYDEDGTFGGTSCAFRIFVNATIQVFLSVDGSGAIFTNPGDTVEVQIVGTSGTRKHIDVQDTIAGEIYNADVTLITHSFSFITIVGHDYTINGEGGNP